MVKEMVVKESLSREMIDAGTELTRLLDESRLILDAALWYYSSENNYWVFVVASPEVRTQGPRNIYKKVQTVISRSFGGHSIITLKDISVVDSKDPLIMLLRNAVTVDGVSGIRFSQNVINGVFIEDAYIYRLK
jgi:hypothetical protein